MSKRGTIIGGEKWDKLEEINTEISNKLDEDEFLNDM